MKRGVIMLAGTALLGLGACHRQSADTETPPVDDNASAPAPEPAAPAPPPIETLPPPSMAPTTNASADLPEKAPPPSPDQQMQDDAAATGMTARVPDDQPAPAAGDSDTDGNSD